jgi:hypothetical protein
MNDERDRPASTLAIEIEKMLGAWDQEPDDGRTLRERANCMVKQLFGPEGRFDLPQVKCRIGH